MMTSKQVAELNARLKKMLGNNFDPNYYRLQEPENETPLADRPLQPIRGRRAPKKKGLEDSSNSEYNT
jgi:hypothetical protein